MDWKHLVASVLHGRRCNRMMKTSAAVKQRIGNKRGAEGIVFFPVFLGLRDDFRVESKKRRIDASDWFKLCPGVLELAVWELE